VGFGAFMIRTVAVTEIPLRFPFRSRFLSRCLAVVQVCGEFADLPVHGDIPALRTVMMYMFYAAQCGGAIAAMHPRVQQLLSSGRLLTALVVARLPLLGMIYEYSESAKREVRSAQPTCR
jgi:hypothetical protein